MRTWDEQRVMSLYKEGYSKYEIAKKIRKSWHSVDRVIQGYEYALDEIEKETLPKAKIRWSGLPAVYFLLLLGALIGSYYLLPGFVSWLKERQSGSLERKEPESPKSRAFEGKLIEDL